ncbi:MAG: cupin domain-containing protein [Lautropia sp.]
MNESTTLAPFARAPFALAPFELDGNLIALGGDNAAAEVPFRIPPDDPAAIDRLVGIVDFADDESVHADHWEIHPDGDEVLCVLAGRLLATVEQPNLPEREVELGEGQALIIPRATWHRLQVLAPGRLLFLTPPGGSDLCRHADREAGAWS